MSFSQGPPPPNITTTQARMEKMLLSFEKKTDACIDFDFNRLGLRLNTNGLQVLRGVTGNLPAGAVTAVMGPSGAGKTTFLSTLAGRATYGTVTGEVLINGRPQSIERFGNIVGFVRGGEGGAAGKSSAPPAPTQTHLSS